MLVNVVSGDITNIQVDAIVTLINSSGMWFGGVDGAIMRAAGGIYHEQAAANMPLHDGQVVVAQGNAREHKGRFNDVIFVVDDLKSPLSKLVEKALECAKREKYTSIALPAMRTGVMLGAYPQEPDEKTTISAMVKALKSFGERNRTLNLKVNIVVYGSQSLVNMIRAEIRNT